MITNIFVRIGKKWVERYLSNIMEIKHHGVKGQKWGIKNGPPYPIKHLKNANGDDIIIVDHTDIKGTQIYYDYETIYKSFRKSNRNDYIRL